MMQQWRGVVLAIFLAGMATAAVAAEALKAFDGVVLRALTGKARVTVVYLSPKAAGKVLIKFENTGGAWDDKIIPHHLENKGRDFKLTGKKNYNTIAVRDDDWSWFSNTTVYPEGSGDDGIVMVEDKGATERLNLKNFLKEYMKSP